MTTEAKWNQPDPERDARIAEDRKARPAQYIDITPTDEGFANIARMLAASIIGSTFAIRREDTRELIAGLITTVGYLGAKDQVDDTTFVSDLAAAIKEGK